MSGDGIHAVFAVAQLRHVVRFLTKPRIVVARVALVRRGECEVEELAEAISKIERGHDTVRRIVFLRVVNLVEDVVAIFILSVLVGAHIVGVALIVVVRTVVVERGQGARRAVSVAQRIDLSGELLLLLHVGVESHIRLNHLGDARLHVERSGVAVVAVTELHTLFLIITERSVVTRRFATAGKGDGVVVVEGVVRQEAKPIRIRHFGLTRLRHKGVIVNLSRDITVISSFVTHHRHVVGERIVEVHQVLAEAHALLRVHQVDVAVGISRTRRVFELRIVGDARRTGITLLGGHHNHTVGGTRSVERGRRGVLEHVNALNVLRVESRNGITDIVDVVRVIELLVGHIDRIGQGDTVEHPQRFAVADEGGRTANTHTRRRADFTGVLHKHHVGHAPFERLLQAGHAGHEDFVHLERSDGTRLLARADRAVARHHSLAQTLRIVFEHEVIVHHAVFCGLHLAQHTDVGHSDIQTGQTLSGRKIDHIFTGLVRLNGPSLFAVLHAHISSNERFALLVEDHARELVCIGPRGLLSRRGKRKTQRRTHQETPDEHFRMY